MIQAAMYFALGLLTAGVLALLVAPAIWRRAARLTRQRIESAVPMTVAEIQADKDQLRAEFAMTARRLEMTVDRLRDKTAEQTIDINEKRAEIVRLTTDGNEKADAIAALEQRTAGLLADIETANVRLEKARADIAEREATLAERQAALAELQGRFEAEQDLNDAQKLELVARNTEIGNLNDRLADARALHDTIVAERDGLARSLADEQSALAAERQRVANLEASLARIEAERIERLEELERRATEARELSAELASGRARAEDLAARVSELEADRDRLRAEIDRGAAEAERLRNELGAHAQVAGGDNIAKAIAATEAEKAALAARLAALEAEQETLRAENEELRRVVGPDWDVASENALLRQRLASVAADVVRLAGGASGEERETAKPKPSPVRSAESGNGNGSERKHPQPHAAEERASEEPSEPAEGKTLAERLRALQHTAAHH